MPTMLPAKALLRSAVRAVLFLTLVLATTAQATVFQYSFTHLAGPLGGWGNADGTGSAARFNSPYSVATDNAGNIYVADTWNHTIRKIASDGTVTTLAGTTRFHGFADGMGVAALFNAPFGVTVDNLGNVYVADTGNNAIRKISPAGAVTTLAGGGSSLEPGHADGTGFTAQFDAPFGVAVDGSGNVYVADTNNSTIRKITPGGVVTTLAGASYSTGFADGSGAAARFWQPDGLTVDNAGNVYVADAQNNAIRKIAPDGSVITLAGQGGVAGSADGLGTSARFGFPTGVAVDTAGNVYVADEGNGTIRKIAPGGAVTTLAGTPNVLGSNDGTGPGAQFHYPFGIAVDNAGNVYVGDRGNDAIRKITPAGDVSTLAGLAGGEGFTNGTGTAAAFAFPSSTAVDSSGNVYVADSDNNAIRKITPGGVVTTLAGSPPGSWHGSADGTGLTAQFFYPTGVAVDSTGTVYVADQSNMTIRKITPTGVVTTLAGRAGVAGSADLTGLAAEFNDPYAVAADTAGNVFVTDQRNETIRKITPAGVVTTLAGNTGVIGSADGTGTAALFDDPAGLAVDSAGNVYVADWGNETIRKITPAGVVTTLAGTAGYSGSADGTGPDARFSDPTGLTVDGSGNLYVADQFNSTIRKITSGGVVTTVAGTPDILGGMDGIGSVAQFNAPTGIAVDGAGALYVADCTNHTIRKGALNSSPQISAQPQSQSVTPGASVQFSVTASAAPAPAYQWYFNGSALSSATSSTLNLAAVSSANAGDYTVVVTNQLGSVTSAKATLTVASVPAPAPATNGNSGGGAMEAWFIFVLLALALIRSRRKISA